MKLIRSEKTFAAAAAKSSMDEKTARKHVKLGRLPSEVKVTHTWRTRRDPFTEDWDEVRQQLEDNPGLEARTLFEYLQRRYPGRYWDGQLRTLQRRVKAWRALEGPPREVFFPQEHKPGELCQSDFTGMNDLGITIGHKPFRHLLYHFVLTYSNWESGTICFSESFESLSDGFCRLTSFREARLMKREARESHCGTSWRIRKAAPTLLSANFCRIRSWSQDALYHRERNSPECAAVQTDTKILFLNEKWHELFCNCLLQQKHLPSFD